MNQKERTKIEVRNRQLKVMAFIRKRGKANTQEIISHFNLRPSQISGIVGQLTKNGEIIGTDSGTRTKKGNTIMDYRITGELDEQPREAPPIEDDFPLLACFPSWVPSVNFTGSTRQHICEN